MASSTTRTSSSSSSSRTTTTTTTTLKMSRVLVLVCLLLTLHLSVMVPVCEGRRGGRGGGGGGGALRRSSSSSLSSSSSSSSLSRGQKRSSSSSNTVPLNLMIWVEAVKQKIDEMKMALDQSKRTCSGFPCMYNHLGAKAGRQALMKTLFNKLKNCAHDPSCAPGKRRRRSATAKEVLAMLTRHELPTS